MSAKWILKEGYKKEFTHVLLLQVNPHQRFTDPPKATIKYNSGSLLNPHVT